MSEPAELLAGRVARGEDAAAEELVEAMRPLVSSMATRFQGRGAGSRPAEGRVGGVLPGAGAALRPGAGRRGRAVAGGGDVRRGAWHAVRRVCRAVRDG